MILKSINALEGKTENRSDRRPTRPQPLKIEANEKKETQKRTALQVLTEMVKARLTQPEVVVLDDHGGRKQETIRSPEYSLLQERGLEVQSVSISNLRFNSAIEQTIISRWSTNWLLNAKAESGQIERKRNLAETRGYEKAIRQYANFLSKDLIQKKPSELRETLKTLLLRTHTLMNFPQLRQRMTQEQDDLESIIRWIEGISL
jgi:hypothetical protein